MEPFSRLLNLFCFLHQPELPEVQQHRRMWAHYLAQLQCRTKGANFRHALTTFGIIVKKLDFSLQYNRLMKVVCFSKGPHIHRHNTFVCGVSWAALWPELLAWSASSTQERKKRRDERKKQREGSVNRQHETAWWRWNVEWREKSERMKRMRALEEKEE